jgi:hypothetical protein
MLFILKRMKKNIIIFGILFSFFLSIVSCKKTVSNENTASAISWIKPVTFRNENISVENLTKKSDEGFLASGIIFYQDKALTHGFVNNLDSNGDTIWCKKIDIEFYPNTGVLYSLKNSDNEIIVAGICSYTSFKKQHFIGWLDSEGNLKKYVLFLVDDNQIVKECKLIPLENGNIYSSVIEEDSQGVKTIIIDLLDKDGKLIRSKQLTGIETQLSRLYLAGNDNLLLTGSFLKGNPDYGDILLLNLDGSGNEVYRRLFGTEGYDVGNAICSDNAGGYLLSGMVTNLSNPVVYPVTSSGYPGQELVIDNPVSGNATIISPGSNGGFNVTVQVAEKLYFLTMGADLTKKQTYLLDAPQGSNQSYIISEVFPDNDGSISFLYYIYGPVIVRTIPLE